MVCPYAAFNSVTSDKAEELITAEIRAIMTQITASVSFLPLLNCKGSFMTPYFVLLTLSVRNQLFGCLQWALSCSRTPSRTQICQAVGSTPMRTTWRMRTAWTCRCASSRPVCTAFVPQWPTRTRRLPFSNARTCAPACHFVRLPRCRLPRLISRPLHRSPRRLYLRIANSSENCSGQLCSTTVFPLYCTLLIVFLRNFSFICTVIWLYCVARKQTYSRGNWYFYFLTSILRRDKMIIHMDIKWKVANSRTGIKYSNRKTKTSEQNQNSRNILFDQDSIPYCFNMSDTLATKLAFSKILSDSDSS